jgi:hypothetical protein
MRRPRRWQSAGDSGEPAEEIRVDADERVAHEEEPVQAELDGVSIHCERERRGARGAGRQRD